MADRYGLLVGSSGGEVAAESFDIVRYERFETLDGGTGEVGMERTAESAVTRMGAGVLNISWSRARNL